MKHQLLGKKIGMTQVYDGENNLVPVTVVQAGPCPVTQVKTKATDGYNAVQIAFGAQKESRLSAGEVGHLRKAGVAPHSHLHEIRLADVIGTVKGRGFQGVVKRHNMDGQPDSHGHMMHRRIGSIGMRQTPGHVFKGKRMPGHMGQVQRTVQNLRVVQVLAEKNLLLIKGSFPGANGEVVLVRPAKKAIAAK
jgi:large subunit ribosomal protein L3